MRADYAILGAGALGTIVAAHLARTNADVVLIARGTRAVQAARDGLTVAGLAQFRVPVRVCTEPGTLSRVGALVVATKAIDTRHALAPWSAIDVDVALSLQNGVQKDELLQASVGEGHVLGAVANISGELRGNGVVNFTNNHGLMIGSLSGAVDERASHIARDLSASGIRAAVVDDIRDRTWSKFAAWAGLAGLSIATRESTGRFLATEAGATVLAQVVREVGALARAHGCQLVNDGPVPAAAILGQPNQEAVATIMEVGRRFQIAAPSHRVSALQDLCAGRPLELQETMGDALRRAAVHGVPVPMLQAVYLIASTITQASCHGGPVEGRNAVAPAAD